MESASLHKKLARAQARVEILEKMIEDKTRDLYLLNVSISASNAYLLQILAAMQEGLLVVGHDGKIHLANDAANRFVGHNDLCGRPWGEVIRLDRGVCDTLDPLCLVGPPREGHCLVVQGQEVPVLVSASRLDMADGNAESVVVVFVDLRERKRLEGELQHAQKLESVGRLAAGIAHEINTPTQFVSDNIHFLKDAFRDVLHLLKSYRELTQRLVPENEVAPLLMTEEEIDLSYLMEKGPKAFESALEGLSRIAIIVKAMKEFAHPEQRTKSFADVNRALASTLDVARNEYKYVAEVETHFGSLPPVPCHIGELNQVFLNLIVNSAHAIADRVGKSGKRGKISIRTEAEGSVVHIAISDDGCGIPEGVQSKIFDPFFTTKEVGRGTGQGLAIARSVIVDKHQGTLTFDTVPDHGTTFHIRIPLDAPAKRVAA